VSKAADLIAALGLEPLLPEGGYYRETFRSVERLGTKAMGTAIYYLLTAETFSALHRLPTEEVYHFYQGDPVQMLLLGPEGGRVVILGADVKAGQRPQFVVPRGVWQGSRVAPGGKYALMGTTMTPGYDPGDYEAGSRSRLMKEYPAVAELIRRLTRT
jgi:predicted cupin superfamily sugar epimerase